MGAAIIPMAFETVVDLTGSVQAAFIAAAYIIFGKKKKLNFILILLNEIKIHFQF